MVVFCGIAVAVLDWVAVVVVVLNGWGEDLLGGDVATVGWVEALG